MEKQMNQSYGTATGKPLTEWSEADWNRFKVNGKSSFFENWTKEDWKKFYADAPEEPSGQMAGVPTLATLERMKANGEMSQEDYDAWIERYRNDPDSMNAFDKLVLSRKATNEV